MFHRPGPSQGKKPKFALSGIKRELRAYKTPLIKIKTIANSKCMNVVNHKSAVPKWK
jgi:hypothetical protein